jgi:heme-degrading monooxygenase HmoA
MIGHNSGITLAKGTKSMYARITNADIQQGKMNDAIKTYEEVVLTATQKQEGYVSAILLVDRDAHKAISITVWESEDALAAGEVSPYYIEQLKRLAQFFAGMPQRESYEVAVYTRHDERLK